MPPIREGHVLVPAEIGKNKVSAVVFNERFRLATEGHSAQRRSIEGERLGANRAWREVVTAIPSKPPRRKLGATMHDCTSIDTGGRAACTSRVLSTEGRYSTRLVSPRLWVWVPGEMCNLCQRALDVLQLEYGVRL